MAAELKEPRTSVSIKLVIIAIAGAIALAGAFIVNQNALRDIRQSVDEISLPHEKLRYANRLMIHIYQSEDAFRSAAVTPSAKEIAVFNASNDQVDSIVPRFAETTSDDLYQHAILDSLGKILRMRRHVLNNYLDYRNRIRQNRDLHTNAALLDSIITENQAEIDSMVITDIKEKTEVLKDTLIGDEEKKNWLTRIFSGKKDKQVLTQTTTETTNTTSDTILIRKNNYDAGEAKNVLKSILEQQDQRRAIFYEREKRILSLDEKFHEKIAELIHAIQTDIHDKYQNAVAQGNDAIRSTINIHFLIIVAFIVLTIVMTAFIILDVSRVNRYRRLLEEAKTNAEFHSAQRKRFLSNMSHEIRTPLQTIIGFAGLLDQSGTNRADHVKAISSAALHLQSIVNDILEFQKTEQKLIELRNTSFLLSEMVQPVFHQLRYLAESRNLLFRTQLDFPENTFILADAKRLRQLLYNIIGNSIKFTEKGAIDIRLSLEGNQITLHVSDTGKGISASFLPHIFDEYTQDEKIPAGSEGTGLGMAIVKRIVDAWGGSIHVTSEEGKGTGVTVQLPVTLSLPGEATASSAESHIHHLPENIWIIDDDTAIVQFCSAVLDGLKIRTTTFVDASALMASMQQSAPDVLLMDIRMPGMTGKELIRLIDHRKYPKVRFLAMTAETEPEQLAELRELGFDDILIKPFTPRQLTEAVSVHVSKAVRSGLEKFTGGDETLVKEMMDSLITETRHDLAEIDAHVKASEWNKASLLFHRVSGRMSQFGLIRYGQDYQLLEKITDNRPEDFIHNDWMKLKAQTEVLLNDLSRT